MKKIIVPFVLLLAIVAGTASCKKIIDAVFPGLDVDVPEIVITVPYFPFPPGTPIPQSEDQLVSVSQSFNMDSIIKVKTNGQFGIGDISSVKIKKMVFTIANADAQNNFANFERARFTFSSNTNTNAQEIAALTFPDTYTPAVTYTAPDNSPELLPYLKGTQLIYNVYGKIRRFTTKALTVSVLVTMKVK